MLLSMWVGVHYKEGLPFTFCLLTISFIDYIDMPVQVVFWTMLGLRRCTQRAQATALL